MPSNGAGVRRQISGSFESFSSRRLTISVSESLPVSSVISVQCEDAMFLGEVAICTTEGDEHWQAEVRVEQILSGLAGLMSLRARLLGEPVPELAHVRP